MKKYAFLLFLPLALLAFARPAYPTRPIHPAHPTAFDTYISFTGTKQGLFKGQTAGKGGREKDGWFLVRSFEIGVETPTDPKSGSPKGARQKGPISITKEVDAASPLLLDAHYKNELFTTVVLETVGRPQSGAGEVVTERITLTNATISDYKTNSGVESVSFTYGQLTKTK
jgi:type VI secretion system Hcp family effector